MAYCSNCGTQMSDDAPSCPQCGHPNERRRVSGQLAGFWIRFAALFIDWLVLLIPSLIISSVLPYVGGFALAFLYDWLMVANANGQTVGKMALGIKVARPDGTAVDSGTAAGRAAMKIVSGLPFGLGFLWAAFDAEKRTWHDLVADTRVFVAR